MCSDPDSSLIKASGVVLGEAKTDFTKDYTTGLLQ